MLEEEVDDKNVSAEELIDQLSESGRYPDPDLIEEICERREEFEPLMLALFRDSYDDDWIGDDDPHWYRFLHAGKFMLSWRVVAALPTFAKMFSDDAKQDWCEWYEEDLYHYGPPAIPHLVRVLNGDSNHEWHYGRALAGSTLTRIATYFPETRDEILAVFRSYIPNLEDARELGVVDEMWADMAHELAVLADEESRENILALDDAGLLENYHFSRQAYLRGLKDGFQPQKPPPPYDILDDYRARYRRHQEFLQGEERKRKLQVLDKSRPATMRTSPKIGRNEPCPCGSGKKYKTCHGRPGS